MQKEHHSPPRAAKPAADPAYAAYIAKFDRLAAGYIPPAGAWTPVDEALYGPPDPFRVPYARALEMQLRAVRFALERHYAGNKIYRKFCRERGFTPEQVKTTADLDAIPLLPDSFFKDYPDGRDFALWLGNIVTGELPKVVIRRSHPGYDDVIDAFNESGMAVMFSSGTSGRHTFIPRDRRTFLAAEYAMAKAVVAMAYPLWERGCHEYLLMPHPRKTNLFAGRACAIFFDVVADVRVAIDRKVTTGLIRLTMAGQGGVKGRVVRYFSRRQWGAHDRRDRPVAGTPRKRRRQALLLRGALHPAAGAGAAEKSEPALRLRRARLGRDRRRLEGVRGNAHPAGRLPPPGRGGAGHPQPALPRHVRHGREQRLHAAMPEGHYLHAPHSFFRPLVLGPDQRPLPYGQWGRFAFLDAAALSYPGFILSGDRARMLARCPACDRPGPVLDPEISRVGRRRGARLRRGAAAPGGRRRETRRSDMLTPWEIVSKEMIPPAHLVRKNMASSLALFKVLLLNRGLIRKAETATRTRYRICRRRGNTSCPSFAPGMENRSCG